MSAVQTIEEKVRKAFLQMTTSTSTTARNAAFFPPHSYPPRPLILLLSLAGMFPTRRCSSQSATAPPSSSRRCWRSTAGAGGDGERNPPYEIKHPHTKKTTIVFREAPQFCLVQVTTLPIDPGGGPGPGPGGGPGGDGAAAAAAAANAREYYLEDDECPLAILMNHIATRGERKKL